MASNRNSHDNMSSGPRTSSTSVRASSIETTVTKLLMATKHLLQVLTQWSKGKATGKVVSDAYVQLGNDFKLVSKHFAHQGVDVSDLGNVPLTLRPVLEATLREQPSDETLNKHLPQIREIIVNLLDKLKVKQSYLKTMRKEQQMARINSHHDSNDTRHTSVSSSVSSSLALSTSGKIDKPAFKILSPNNLESSGVNDDETLKEKQYYYNESIENHVKSDSTSKSNNLEIPVNKNNNENSDERESDALLQLKKGTNLQRRASKRYSAFHMAKLTSQSANEAMAAVNLPSTTSTEAMNTTSVAGDVTMNTINTVNNAFNTINDYAEAGQKEKTNHKLIENSNEAAISKNEDNISEFSHKKMYTLFLRLKGKTKRCHIPLVTNMNELRLLFVERFTYSPGGETFPDIYIMDKEHSVFFELDEQDILEIKDGSILELRTEDDLAFTQKKMDDMMKQFRTQIEKSKVELLEELRQALNRQTTNDIMQQQQPITVNKDANISKEIIKDIRHQVSILKQVYSSNKKETERNMQTVLSKVSEFKETPIETISLSSKSYIEKSQDELGNISDILLSRVDELQDVIEVLRKDVANRGSKPTKKKMNAIFNEKEKAEQELKNMEKFIDIEKPHWKKIWENKLDKVCEEQQFLTLQEDLINDLKEDLNRASETFNLIKLCCEEKEKYPTNVKTNPPIIPLMKPGTFNQVREQMLLSVQSLTPDYESRADAIEKAQKIWEKEKEFKDNDEFRDELGDFVGNANLKKAGGVEEIERQRRQKDEENLRSNFGGQLL